MKWRKRQSCVDARIAFLIHEMSLVTHYAPVWAQMKGQDYCVLIEPPLLYDKGAFKVVRDNVSPDVEVISIYRALAQRRVFAIAVANWAREILVSDASARGSLGRALLVANSFAPQIVRRLLLAVSRVKRSVLALAGGLFRGATKAGKSSLEGSRPHRACAPRLFGVRAVKWPYGLDLTAEWGLDEKNDCFDHFLCHGPIDSVLYQKRFNKSADVIGYPRYEVALAKPTRPEKYILWMPTAGILPGEALFEDFLHEIVDLSKDERVIFRPHPIMWRNMSRGQGDFLRSHFEVVESPHADTVGLIQRAEVVLADFGGTPFGALFLERPCALLRSGNWAPGDISLTTYPLLEDVMPIVRPGEINQVVQKFRNLDDSSPLTENMSALRTALFGGPVHGQPGSRAVDVLRRLAAESANRSR